MSAVPLSYLIDKEGKIYTGYYGGRTDHETLLTELLGRAPAPKGDISIEKSSDFLNLRGAWEMKEGVIQQTDAEVIPSAMLFQPVVEKGEITLQARILSGEEGIRVMFGYQKPEQYFVWNIGADKNTSMTVEKWYTLDGVIAFYEILNEPPQLSLQKEVWHSIRLVVDANAGTLDGFLDGNRILTFKTGSQPVKGQFGLGTWRTTAEFKDIKVEAK